LIAFLIYAVGVSLSGVMAPGPATAATVLAGTHRKHAGILISLGHGIVEFPLMVLVVSGITLLEAPWIKTAVGLAGGTALLLMGASMLLSLRKPTVESPAIARKDPILTGIVVTAGNPYFLIWWVTVGMALCVQAVAFGRWGFAVFALVHWLCDVAWLEVISIASYGGSKLLGPKARKLILLVCGAAMLFFGCTFIYTAVAAWPAN